MMKSGFLLPKFCLCDIISSMNSMRAKEIAKKWEIIPRQVQRLCATGKIPGALRFGKAWVISFDAKKPENKQQKLKPQGPKIGH
jgi:hypothetical protein